jgi:hypothetical protein
LREKVIDLYRYYYPTTISYSLILVIYYVYVLLQRYDARKLVKIWQETQELFRMKKLVMEGTRSNLLPLRQGKSQNVLNFWFAS